MNEAVAIQVCGKWIVAIGGAPTIAHFFDVPAYSQSAEVNARMFADEYNRRLLLADPQTRRYMNNANAGMGEFHQHHGNGGLGEKV